MVTTLEGSVTLAPTFDHASSLGRNERDEERMRRLETRDRGSSVEHYAARAASAFYATPNSLRPLSTLAAFQEAARIAPRAALICLSALGRVPRMDFENVISRVPASEMSGPARRFALKLLEVNQRRLLDIASTTSS